MTQTQPKTPQQLVDRYARTSRLLRLAQILLMAVYAVLAVLWGLTGRYIDFLLLSAFFLCLSKLISLGKMISLASLEELLQQRCDADGYLSAVNQITQAGRNPREHAELQMKLGKAQLYAGRPAEALALLKKLKEPRKAAQWFLWANLVGNCYAELEDRPGLEKLMEQTRERMKKPMLSQAKGMGRQILAIFQRTLDFWNGDYEACRQKLEAMLENARTQQQKVMAHVWLSRVWLAQNRPDEARPHLEYAAEHGGDLAAAQQARRLLGGIVRSEEGVQ